MTGREAFVHAARQIVGLTEPAPALGALVDPGGDAAHQAQVAELSLCMLVYRGLLCRVLDIDPRDAGTDRPYVPGSIPAILRGILGVLGIRVPTLEEPPGPGDGLWWAANGPHVEHVDACVVEISYGRGTDNLLTIDLLAVAGGQRDGAGHETISEVARTLAWSGGQWVCQATGRRLRWVLDCEALAAHYGLAFDSAVTLPTGAPAT